MRTLIVYYTRNGSTRKVAEELKAQLGGGIEEITESRGRGGILGWIRSGREASSGSTVSINPPKAEPSRYDLVVVGTPTWAWNVSSPVRSYLKLMKGKLPRVAFFCCYQSSSGSTFDTMAKFTSAPIATIEVKETEVKSGEYKEMLKTFADSIRAAVP